MVVASCSHHTVAGCCIVAVVAHIAAAAGNHFRGCGCCCYSCRRRRRRRRVVLRGCCYCCILRRLRVLRRHRVVRQCVQPRSVRLFCARFSCCRPFAVASWRYTRGPGSVACIVHWCDSRRTHASNSSPNFCMLSHNLVVFAVVAAWQVGKTVAPGEVAS